MPDIRVIPLDTPGWYVVANGKHTASVKVYDQPSQFGILGGRISKLSIQDGLGQQVFNYDRNFDIDYLDQEGRAFLEAVVNRMNWNPVLHPVAEFVGWCFLGSALGSVLMIALDEWRKSRRS